MKIRDPSCAGLLRPHLWAAGDENTEDKKQKTKQKTQDASRIMTKNSHIFNPTYRKTSE